MEEGCCLLFRNLRTNATHGHLSALILQLMNEVILLDISLRERDIIIEGDPDETKIAIVYIRCKRDLEKTLQYVDSFDTRRRLRFDFNEIVEPTTRCAVIPVFKRPNKYYIESETLTLEDNSEYRSGSGAYVHVQMRDDLSKFICAALNVGPISNFYVGINENGCVHGTEISTSKEDVIRKDIIEQSIKDIRPPVMPWYCKVEFTPVLANGIIKEA